MTNGRRDSLQQQHNRVNKLTSLPAERRKSVNKAILDSGLLGASATSLSTANHANIKEGGVEGGGGVNTSSLLLPRNTSVSSALGMQATRITKSVLMQRTQPHPITARSRNMKK